MDEYPLEIPPGEVLAWVRADRRRKTPLLWVRASKRYEVEPDETGALAQVGEDQEAVAVVVSGLMEISPRRGAGGWTLQISASDPEGLRPRGEDDGYEDDDDIGIDAFAADFLASASSRVDVVAQADNATAWRRCRRWLASRQKGLR